MAEDWAVRAGTLDRMIVTGVVALNEYRLPARFAPGDIVIDVGAHIGSFAFAVVSRGCEHVHSFEPDGVNCTLAAENLKGHIDAGRVRLIQGAVWRSDANEDELRFDGYQPFPKSYAGMENILNTGAGSVIWGIGEPVGKVAFDDVVDSVTNQGKRRIRLLKLDCEGAEWPILVTSRRLHLIDEIVGEFHEIGGEFLEIGEDRPSRRQIFGAGPLANCTIEELVRFLHGAGFHTTYRRHRRPTGALEGLGLFFAARGRSSV